MTRIARMLTGAAIAASLSATALAQDVAYDYHRGQDFSQLRTYSIREAPRPDANAADSGALYDSPIVQQQTNALVAAQLEGRGMTRDDQNPDVYVTTRRAFRTEYVNYGSPGWGYGYGWGYGGYGPWYTETIVKGTLTVDVVSAKTGELLWRGIADRDMHPTSKPESRIKRINREVTKMFRNYPTNVVATSGRSKPKPVD